MSTPDTRSRAELLSNLLALLALLAAGIVWPGADAPPGAAARAATPASAPPLRLARRSAGGGNIMTGVPGAGPAVSLR